MDKNKQYVDIILQKLKNFLGIKTDKDLAKTLGVSSQTINNWKNRETLDYLLIISFCGKNNIDLNSLFLEDHLKLVDKKTDSIVLSTLQESVTSLLTVFSNDNVEKSKIIIDKLDIISTSLKINRAKSRVVKNSSSKEKLVVSGAPQKSE